MKIYICHSKSYDYKNELYIPIRASSLNTDHKIILPHEADQTDEGFSTRDVIKTCDLVVAEVSFAATGLGIELGWADAFGRPIICIYRAGSTVPGSISFLTSNVIEYSNHADMISRIVDAISIINNQKQ
jgi:nucleoside 2-deoxyribosyltransferase